MRKIVVEAFEDQSRPQGGHAVILLRDVTEMPDRPSIRLRPVESDLDGSSARGLWRGGRLQPLTTRATPEGIELVIGPDVVGHPNLLSGTPVIIEVPEADVRGEFLWPSVTPLAQPRRRHVVVPRDRRGVPAAVAPMPSPANDSLPASSSGNENTPLVANAGVAGNLALRSEVVVAPAAVPDAPAAVGSPHQATAPAPAATADAVTAATPAADPNAAPAPRSGPEAPPAPATIPTSAEKTDAAAAPPGLQPRVAGDLAWTPNREPEGTARRRLLRYGMAAAGLLALGFYVKSRYAVDPDMQLSERFARPPVTQQGSETRAAAPAGGSVGGGQGEAPRGGGSAVAAGPAAIAAKPAGQSCTAPDVQTEPLAGGRMRVVIAARCKAREEVHLVYGGADQVARLDDGGRLTWTLDGFAGDKEPLELRFADASKQSVPVKTLDLDRVSKVAVIWRTPVNLDLHAFEYAALAGGKGHVWAGAAGTAEAATAAAAAEHKGRGFLSTANDGSAGGDRVEVYTFLHAEDQTTGAVDLALDHATRGETPGEATCGKGDLAEVPYTVVVLARGSSPRRENGLIAAAPCGVRLGADVRFRQSAMPALRIKK